jgi:hypothetical protein
MSGSEEKFGTPDERLRATLERELGEVPPESPSQPTPKVTRKRVRGARVARTKRTTANEDAAVLRLVVRAGRSCDAGAG